MKGFIDEDCRDETGKYFFSESCEVTHQETTFQRNHTKQNDHDPKTNPTAPGKELQLINLTKLK